MASSPSIRVPTPQATSSLEPLVTPPVDSPAAMLWLPSEEALLVASRGGALYQVEPTFGTRPLLHVQDDPACLALRGDRLAVMSRSGLLQVWNLLNRRIEWESLTSLYGVVQLAWWKGGLAVVGDEPHRRLVRVFGEEGPVRGQQTVPPRTAIGATPGGDLMLATNTEQGLLVAPYGQPIPDITPTSHQLRVSHDGSVVGIAAGGVALWLDGQPQPTSFKLSEVASVSLSSDRALLAMGTRAGRVALVRTNGSPAERMNPPRVDGHDHPVLSIAFSRKGKWLATLADRCRLWAY